MGDKENGDFSPIDGTPRKDSHVHDTTQVHLGSEYLLCQSWYNYSTNWWSPWFVISRLLFYAPLLFIDIKFNAAI